MKKIADLTDNEVRCSQRINVCTRAVRAMIKEIVGEYETTLLSHDALWHHIFKKYGPFDRDERKRLVADADTGALVMLDPVEFAMAQDGDQEKSMEAFLTRWELDKK